ncbi:tRNA/rRNA methyltransferase [Simiduia curdlanivorans]|uniref:tRNA/rRNA methyltransferase n=1 Tax=Simiduia curdlanivorans TaxID=1492769 RepID=A0ABV8V3K2_9GAMM|nr:tRNA/rRNA methyltransferase [Simiduia curdlanivorans]MDN3638191.1 tRNA/rRNA methyltransferase [Simiduia curdlanivorans]
MDVVFILVAPAVPENIGASCRALKTMGFEALRLVATEAHRHKPARIVAHGSGDILEAAQHYPTLTEALADLDLVIGTSAKARHQWRSLTPAHELSALLAGKQGCVRKVGLVFGCEASGLSNAQLALCDLVSNIELPAPYPSLNLAQAVMLYAYELRGLHGQRNSLVCPDAQQYAALRAKVRAVLAQQDYDESSKLARWALEVLPNADAKAIGFLHSLCDKLLKP